MALTTVYAKKNPDNTLRLPNGSIIRILPIDYESNSWTWFLLKKRTPVLYQVVRIFGENIN